MLFSEIAQTRDQINDLQTTRNETELQVSEWAIAKVEEAAGICGPTLQIFRKRKPHKFTISFGSITVKGYARVSVVRVFGTSSGLN